MTFQIRRAAAADQKTIKSLVRAAGINPLDLKWQRFLIAEEEGQVVGVGQVRRHGDGSRELASLAVVPERRGQGIGDALVYALMAQEGVARESGRVFLFCQNSLEGYYARFGFAAVGRPELPPKLRLWHRMGNLMASVASRFEHHPFHIVAMAATAPLVDYDARRPGEGFLPG